MSNAAATSAVAPVNVIVGKEGLLIDRARLSIIAAVRRQAATERDPKGMAVPVESIRAGDVTAAEMLDFLNPSLFGEDRVVVFRDCDKAGKEAATLIVNAAKEPTIGVTLIVQHSGEGRQKNMVQALAKLGARRFEANAISRGQLPSFVRDEFGRHNCSVSKATVDTVLDAVGSDLRELATAISQLCSDTGGKVTPTAVRTYYGATAEVSGFDIAELALSGRGGEALAKTRRALQLGVSPVLLSAALSGMVGDIAKLHAARGVNPRQDAGRFGMQPWKIEKTLRVAKKWSTPAVAEAQVVATRLQAAVKGESRSPEFAIEQAVVELARIAQASHRR